MQTTTAAFDAEKVRDGQKPVLLLELQLTGETRRLANRRVHLAGQNWLERIAAGVTLEHDASFDPSGSGNPRINSVAIELANADDGVEPWSDILALRTFASRRAILRQCYLTAAGTPLASADQLTLIDGTLRLPEDDLFSDTTLRMEITDGSPAWHLDLGTPINATDFPGAASDVLGRIQPIIYGSILKHQCIPVDIGARTTLREAVAAAATTVKLTDASAFPASGSIYIDGDEIAYTGKSTNDLTGCSSVTDPHAYGASVVEKQSAYDYLVADHAVKAISAVYIRAKGGKDEDWVLVPAAEYTAYPTGGGGYAGKANVRFSSAEFLRRAVNLVATNASHDHATDTQYHEYPSTPSIPAVITGTYTTVTMATTPKSGTAANWHLRVASINTTSGADQWAKFRTGGGSTLITITPADVSASGDFYVTEASPGTSYQVYLGASCTQVVISLIERDIITAATSDAKAPAITISGQTITDALYGLDVAVDVDGYADTVGGTYTGSASALIIRPADQLRHIGVVRCGWALADRFDATTFNAARSAEASAGVRLDFSITEAINSADLFEQIRHQTCSAHALGPDGKYKRYLAPFTGSSVHTFTETRDCVDLIRVGLTPADDLYNVVGINYAPDPWDGEARGYIEDEDATSQGTGNPPTPGYGSVRRWLQTFGMIQDDTCAAWVAAAWLAWLKDQRYMIELTVRPEWIALEPWDCLAVTSARLPGDWTAKAFVVQSVTKQLGRPASGDDQPNQADDRIILRCREV
jgi:hypothetical protein